MNLTRCSNSHFYDADKHDSCPHCSKMSQPGDANAVTQAASGAINVGVQQETVGKIPESFINKMESNNVTAGKDSANNLQGAVDDVKKTVAKFNVVKGKDPVVGWLVCIDGPHKGEDFRLKMGKNFVGRAQSMDVVLSNDQSVSREKHAIVVYEPKGNIFIVQSGESKELSYLNDEVVLAPQKLNAYDTILLGNTTLLFVPFCNSEITWDKYSDK